MIQMGDAVQQLQVLLKLQPVKERHKKTHMTPGLALHARGHVCCASAESVNSANYREILSDIVNTVCMTDFRFIMYCSV